MADSNVLAAIARGVPFNALSTFSEGLDEGRNLAEKQRIRNALLEAGRRLGGVPGALIGAGEPESGVGLYRAQHPELNAPASFDEYNLAKSDPAFARFLATRDQNRNPYVYVPEVGLVDKRTLPQPDMTAQGPSKPVIPAPVGGAKPPSGYRFKEGSNGKELEPIPGGPGTVLPSELAARVGLADTFAKRVPDLEKRLEKTFGPKSGWAVGPRGELAISSGEPGRLRRDIDSGVDALQRMLTGAGMNVSEAQEYSGRYRIGPLDSYDTMKQKLSNLTSELATIKQSVMRGKGGVAGEGAGLQRPPEIDEATWGRMTPEDQRAYLEAPE